MYIRYLNQTKYDNYLAFHKQPFLDTIGLCPNWEFVGFYVDEGGTAPNMETAEAWSKLLQDCYDGKVDLVITQKASNVSKKLSEISFCSRILAALEKPVGIYFISEDIYTLASYYQDDLKDPFFLPTPDWQVLPDDECQVRGMLHEKHLWAGNVKNQIAKMWELYNAVLEKPNWLTAQDIERYEKQMAGAEQKAASIDMPITPVPDLNVQPTDIQTTSFATTLDEEEISHLIDVVLCADDITPDTREWAAEIHKFFEGGHKQTTKAKILKAFYGKLDTDYTTETGDYLYLTADDGGLTFEIEGQQFTEDYGTLVSRIDRLILTGAYPFSSADTVIDDYAIPDELEEMQSIADEDENNSDEPPASAELSETDRQKIIDEYLQHGSGTQGGRKRIFQAMLSMGKYLWRGGVFVGNQAGGQRLPDEKSFCTISQFA